MTDKHKLQIEVIYETVLEMQAQIQDCQKLRVENKRLKETIMELKEMQRKQTLWIAAELGLNHADTEQIIKESITATTTEMP